MTLSFALSSAACGSDQGSASAVVGVAAAKPVEEALQPKLASSVQDGATGVPPGLPVTLTTTSGTIVSATLVGVDGTVVKTAISNDKHTWRNDEPLGYGKKYTIKAEVMGAGGSSTMNESFTTSVPKSLTMPYLGAGNAGVAGIGQPVAVKFDEPIPDRAAAQKAITVTTDPPVDGAFYWISPTEVRWRPEHFWKPGTKVSVEVHDYGVDLGNGLYGQQDTSSNFTIGDEFLAVADDTTHQIQVFVNGDLVRTIPTAMGTAKHPTNNGYYIVGERDPTIIMDSSTYGVPIWAPEGYRVNVKWATQISYSGIYVHSAPWSLAQQGHSDASHGCLNVSPEDAKWFLEHAKRGDVVLVKNTVGTTLSGVDGLGDWNVPWETWKAGNSGAN